MPSQRNQRAFRIELSRGFSLLELLVSVAIIVILMTIIFAFLGAAQQHYRSQQALATVNQGGRSAIEVMTIELHQAGSNPVVQTQYSLASAATPAVVGASSAVVSVSLNSTAGIFYGSRLIIGNNCTPPPPGGLGCDQEDVTVNMNPTASTTAMTTSSVPVAIINPHASGEAVFVRNYPYPNGVLYDNRTAGTGLGVAVNRIRFFGDILNTGQLYYEEYRLQCPGTTAGSYIDACTTGCMAGPFELTRFITKLANSSGVFSIPASRAASGDKASPLVTNVQGKCASTAGVTWPVTVNDETASTCVGGTGTCPPGTCSGTCKAVATVNQAVDYSTGTAVNIDPVVNVNASGSIGSPALWLKMNTYGSYDSTTGAPDFSSYVTDVNVNLTVQTAQKDPVTGTYRTEILNDHIVPRNVSDALKVAQQGGAALLPQVPVDPTNSHTLPLP
jgi:prepilin-type N-terminal cleavage/methylation domain-containing protein